MAAGRREGDAELEVRLLGPIEVLERGQPIALGGPKPRALLALLALEPGRVVSVDRIVEGLWPGEAPETASHAVQVYVSQLRKALGPVIATRAPGYLLELSDSRIDLHRFTRLSEDGRAELQSGNAAAAEAALRGALTLWRGPAMADFLYEPFAQADIARLEELRLVTLEERIEADLELGRHVELVSELEALVQSEPLRERPRGQLMLALYRSGRQADALAAYRAARDALVDELGIEPGPELKQLEAAILRQDESLLPPEAALAKPAMQFRRLVTILFVDVVESMALAEQLDAEALGQVLRRYFETVSGALTQHGGTVEKFAGDAVMAAFGVPVSHEDDALRAARAALDIRAGVGALNDQLTHEHGLALDIRIGLEAGEVVASPTEARQRLVTGEAVGIAARLEQAAATNEIVVGPVAARLIDHAAVLDPLGELGIKGKRDPVQAYRLLELAPAAPAFERRLDAPLVGRKRELAALRKALKRVVDGPATHAVTVVGPPGIGKSRLATELVRRAKGVTALWGRCLSYGDGITYSPLREVVREAPECPERDAVLEALDAETPPPAPEIAWIFRQLCEAVARERPLVLVFDDLQWAEPTFLELLELLVDRAQAPIFVVSLSREELLEGQPDFLEGRPNAERVVLDTLPADDMDALVAGLGGDVLESDQRARIVETAEGNPFFVEQLLALGLEGGLGERPLPPTVQALLVARLDRLGPGERAVLERGAVVGKEFTEADVVALLAAEAAPTAVAHLRALSDRGFVRPRGEDLFAFRHVLVEEAVYRAAPKRLRAELHERFADRLDRTAADLAELDELVGFHLERAYRLRTELGESDRRTEGLAGDAGRSLGSAGMRAFRRGDMHAARNLLERSTGLPASDVPAQKELACDLGLAYYAMQEPERAIEVLLRIVSEPETAATASTRARALIELEFIRARYEVGRTADELLDAIEAGIPTFQRAADDRALGRALLLGGWVQGGRRGDHAAWRSAAERALDHYRLAGWPLAICLGQIGNALYWGPTPVPDAISRIESLLDDADRQGRANLETFLGGLSAQLGEFDRARQLITSARLVLEDLGLRAQARTYSLTVIGEIELLSGRFHEAEVVLRDLCVDHEQAGEYSHLASSASDLAEALLLQDREDEAERWTQVARKHAARDDVQAQMMWRPVQARIEARNGVHERADRLARSGIEIAETTDDLNRTAKAYLALGITLTASARTDDAAAAYRRARELFEQKGNIVGARSLRSYSGAFAVM